MIMSGAAAVGPITDGRESLLSNLTLDVTTTNTQPVLKLRLGLVVSSWMPKQTIVPATRRDQTSSSSREQSHDPEAKPG